MIKNKLSASSRFLTMSLTLFLLSNCGNLKKEDEVIVYDFPSASNTQYYCDQSRQMIVSLGVNAEAANVRYDGNIWRLERVSPDQNAYTDGTRTLLIDGDGIYALEAGGIPFLTGCTTERHFY